MTSLPTDSDSDSQPPPPPPPPPKLRTRSTTDLDKPLPLPPPQPRHFPLLWTLVVPLIIALYLTGLYTYHLDRRSSHLPCDPTHNPHCWGLTTPHRLRGEGLRDRTQLGIESATLLMLVRNSELESALASIREIEDRFNRHYRYPWTFLNDEEFTEEFKLYTSIAVSGEVKYGKLETGVDGEWSMPSWIDKEKFEEAAERMESEGVIYGNSTTYRKMCRWYSGPFAHNQLLAGYEYFWRVEPDTRFYCDQLYDPFTLMRERNKSYSFALSLYEYPATIPTLWPTVQEFAASHPDLIHPDNALSFLTDDPPGTALADASYNLCHFWSNFEIASLSFFRSPAYTTFFSHLDASGGFWYERWGDAPVHSIAAMLLLGKEEIHFWRDVGYWHRPFGRCPWEESEFVNGRCAGCEWVGEKSWDWDRRSCLGRWMKVRGVGEWWGEFVRGGEEGNEEGSVPGVLV